MTLNEAILDKQLMADLKDFVIQKLVEQGVEKMFKGQKVDAYPDAKNAIEKAFDLLDDMSGKELQLRVIHNLAR